MAPKQKVELNLKLEIILNLALQGITDVASIQLAFIPIISLEQMDIDLTSVYC